MDTVLSLSAVSHVDEGPLIDDASSSSPSAGTEWLEISCRHIVLYVHLCICVISGAHEGRRPAGASNYA